MTQRNVAHATFTIERDCDVVPERVFAAFADPKIKAKWFSGRPAGGVECRPSIAIEKGVP